MPSTRTALRAGDDQHRRVAHPLAEEVGRVAPARLLRVGLRRALVDAADVDAVPRLVHRRSTAGRSRRWRPLGRVAHDHELHRRVVRAARRLHRERPRTRGSGRRDTGRSKSRRLRTARVVDSSSSGVSEERHGATIISGMSNDGVTRAKGCAARAARDCSPSRPTGTLADAARSGPIVVLLAVAAAASHQRPRLGRRLRAVRAPGEERLSTATSARSSPTTTSTCEQPAKPGFSPYVYPWGWPLLLARSSRSSGFDFAELKLLEVACFCGFLWPSSTSSMRNRIGRDRRACCRRRRRPRHALPRRTRTSPAPSSRSCSARWCACSPSTRCAAR